MNAYRMIRALSRPRILISAARLGMADYDRDTDLRFITRNAKTPSHEDAMHTLLAREKELEADRKDGSAQYSVHEHIRVLTALLAEIRLPKMARENLLI